MPKLDQVVRTTVEDSLARAPRRYMVWHTVKQYAPDEAALDILSYILSTGRTSRLQSKLLYEKEMVASVGGGNNTGEIGGTFQIQATARPGKNLDDIEAEINKEIERIKKEPPTAEEIARAKNSIQAQTIFGLQTVLGKGSQIGNYAGFLKNPNYFQADLDRYSKVTAADVQRVANTYLTANHLIMSYVPKQGEASRSTSAANRPTSVKAEDQDDAKTAAQAAKLPKAGPNPKLALPPIEKARLSNGLEVWMVKQSELPIVSMNMVFKTGAAAEPKGKDGVANMASTLIDDGTKTRSAEEITNQLAIDRRKHEREFRMGFDERHSSDRYGQSGQGAGHLRGRYYESGVPVEGNGRLARAVAGRFAAAEEQRQHYREHRLQPGSSMATIRTAGSSTATRRPSRTFPAMMSSVFTIRYTGRTMPSLSWLATLPRQR